MSKYHAKPTTIDGIRFDSQKEARRYQELKLLERAGEIRNLERQPEFDLNVVQRSDDYNYSKKVGVWRGDFRYEERRYTAAKRERWDVIVEDVKGFKTPVYRLKKRMVEAQYGIQIREV
jgi:hypothetical protein